MSNVKINDTTYVRDLHSKAILNTDKNGLNDYLIKRKIAKQQQDDAQETKNKIVYLEMEMMEIKNMLTELLKRNHYGN